MVMAHKPLSSAAFVPHGGKQRRRVYLKTVRWIVGNIRRGQNAVNARFAAKKQPANLFFGRPCGFRQNSLPRGS